jgi:S-adenosylmethionine synthetase
MKEKILFTSESVSEGHPDKLCDQISDAILDACLEQDSESHVACECFATTNLLVIGGEITTNANVDYEKIAREVMISIGYDSPEKGIDGHTCEIINRIKKQSPDINMGVVKENEEEQGAGDQGIMFGYACNETENYMPLAIGIAHKLVRYASTLRKKGEFKGSRPDMKSQVTIDYTSGNPQIETILMSIQHDPDVNMDEFKRFIKENVILPVVKSYGFNEDYKVLINPTGRFVIGGPEGDTGLTGRKIIVDTYGGVGKHGGGAFSGKDPSKVDRSAAYAARYVAKNLCAAGVSDRVEVQLSYAIGEADPLSIAVDTFGQSKYDQEKILSVVRKLFDLRPNSIIKTFKLTQPPFKYVDLASYGHFGRPDVNCPWEYLDKVEDIKKLLEE